MCLKEDLLLLATGELIRVLTNEENVISSGNGGSYVIKVSNAKSSFHRAPL